MTSGADRKEETETLLHWS